MFNTSLFGSVLFIFDCLAPAGIPVEEEEEEQDTSIKGRLLALLYKIKGPPQKTEEEPKEAEQAAPSKQTLLINWRWAFLWTLSLFHYKIQTKSQIVFFHYEEPYGSGFICCIFHCRLSALDVHGASALSLWRVWNKTAIESFILHTACDPNIRFMWFMLEISCRTAKTPHKARSPSGKI